MTNILNAIIENKKMEVAALKTLLPLEAVQKAINHSRSSRPFFELFEQGPILIGEIKPKSPSHGALTTNPLSIAHIYADSDIDCISVLTDQKYFGGGVELLQQVRAIAPQPIFRKEFVVDVYQIYESAMIEADAVLLIASVLDDATLRECINACNECSLGYIVEIHAREDVEKALRAHARVIGINNRNLDTLTIDLSVTEEMMRLIPSTTYAVSESGIQTVSDVRRVTAAGARGILVGASILTAENSLTQITNLKRALA